jgi:hypothetical protein
LGAQKFLADNNYGPAGDGFYEFQKEHQTVQELKKQVTELAAEEGQSILSIIRRDEQDRKARRVGGRTCLRRSMDFSLTAVGRVTSFCASA